MYLIKLTDEELKSIKDFKNEVNKNIREQNKKYADEIQEIKRNKQRRTYSQSECACINNLKSKIKDVFTGLPMILSIGGNIIYMDYNLLRKIEKSLNKSDLYCDIHIDSEHGLKELVIQYHDLAQTRKGIIQLYEEKIYQNELLTGLPVIKAEG